MATHSSISAWRIPWTEETVVSVQFSSVQLLSRVSVVSTLSLFFIFLIITLLFPWPAVFSTISMQFIFTIRNLILSFSFKLCCVC